MSSTAELELAANDFRDGIQYFAQPWPGADQLAARITDTMGRARG